jgi:hypothetical protein
MFKKFLFVSAILGSLLSCKSESKKADESKDGATLVDPKCSRYSEDKCSEAKNCQLIDTECYATSSFCGQAKKESACDGLTSCKWDTDNTCKNLSSADANPRTSDEKICDTFKTNADCSKDSRCLWDDSLKSCGQKDVDASGLCDQATTEELCDEKTSCVWAGSACVELSKASCSSLSQADCQEAVGLCTWSNNTCKDVDSSSSGSGSADSLYCSKLNVLMCVVNSSRCQFHFATFSCGPKI